MRRGVACGAQRDEICRIEINTALRSLDAMMHERCGTAAPDAAPVAIENDPHALMMITLEDEPPHLPPALRPVKPIVAASVMARR
jgi:hypothetical protein